MLGCAVKMEGSTTNLVLSTMSVTRSEVLTFRAPSLPFSYTNTISPAALQLPSELDWLLFLLLVPMLTTEPLGDVFWGRGLLGRDELWSFSRSSAATTRKEKKQEIILEIYVSFIQFVSFHPQNTSIWEVQIILVKSILVKKTHKNNCPFMRLWSLHHLHIKSTSPSFTKKIYYSSSKKGTQHNTHAIASQLVLQLK